MDDLHSRSRQYIKVCENKYHWTIMQTVYFELTSSACLLQARADWAAPSLLRLRAWHGTTSASSATSAKAPWWARDSSR